MPWLLRIESRLFEALRNTFEAIRAELRLEAETLELEIMTRLRETRLLQPVGMRSSRLGMRVRKPRRPGGSFTLEWYRVRWRGRTDYIARGAGDRYGRKAFIGALAWERAIALDAEQRLSAIRRQLRLMSEIERRLKALQG
ncbi:conjugative transfer protein MobI(A/C), partial [Lamprobacter modestohalophilus]|uniref:conjugative transfer protein MobI(A/C) n=1 Tax=Lamprobacter modestohalophilus TaxID=1064514 RepID=UPI002ADEB27C